MNINDLIEKAKQFSITEEKIKKDEEDRLRFINKFPLEMIKDMTLEQYSVNSKQYPNKYKDTFIYLLEFGKILAGIGGGNASKFYIYMDANGDYCTGSGKNKKILEGEELEREFNTLRDKIYKESLTSIIILIMLASMTDSLINIVLLGQVYANYGVMYIISNGLLIIPILNTLSGLIFYLIFKDLILKLKKE